MSSQKLIAAAIALPALGEALLRLHLRQDLRTLIPATWPLAPALPLPAPALLARVTDRWLRWARHPRPCLPRSLALCLLLRRSGVPVVLHCGVQRPSASGDGGIKGHAWLSLHGQPYLEPQAERLADFVETFRVPAAGLG